MNKPTILNLGCDSFKLPGFINIDINPEVKPDLCINLMEIDKHYKPQSVDFIFAGHIFEHFKYEDSQNLMIKCRLILKAFRTLLIVVPDYSKCFDLPIEKSEKVIMANGDHQMIYNLSRLEHMLRESGFRCFSEVPLERVPYLVVPDINNPKPEPFQTAVLALKI